jgi:hypothetical protein
METRLKQRIELVNKYFIESPKKPNYIGYYIALAVFAFFLLAGRGSRGAAALLVLIGVVGFLIAAVRLYGRWSAYRKAFNRAEPKATDRQMDDWLQEGKKMVEAEARRRLDIDNSDVKAGPLWIDGPANGSYIVAGSDRVLRYKQHNILILYLTDHQVATFQCILDLGPGEILGDRTKEFPFKDITNLETSTSKESFYYYKKEKIVEGIQTFGLYTSGANVIELNFFYSKTDRPADADYIYPPSDADNTIKAIRKSLKEYKDRSGTGAQKPN